MGYVERSVRPARPSIHLGMIGVTDAYDVDSVGMDDGLDRRDEATFRVLFQLGQGYMIYLWVLAVRQPGSRDEWFHSFWTKDCAVAHVDREEHGPPARVRCPPFVLPRIYDTFVLEGAAGPRTYRVGDVSFFADVGDGVLLIDLRLDLTDPDERPCELTWSSVVGWRLHEQRDWRPLVAGERVTFR